MSERQPSPIEARPDHAAWHPEYILAEGAKLPRVEGPGHRAAIIATAEATGVSVRLAEQLEESKVDPLTGLRNTLALKEDIKDIIHSAKEANRTYYLLLYDLDGVKEVNDAEGLGHAMGDCYIRAGARAAAHSLRPTDHIYRIGGDEFLAILVKDKDTEPEFGSSALESIVRKRADQSFAAEIPLEPGLEQSLHENAIGHGISIGATEWDPRFEQFDVAKQRADSSMYDHKGESKTEKALQSVR